VSGFWTRVGWWGIAVRLRLAAAFLCSRGRHPQSARLLISRGDWIIVRCGACGRERRMAAGDAQQHPELLRL
jgi:hypothetical protein